VIGPLTDTSDYYCTPITDRIGDNVISVHKALIP